VSRQKCELIVLRKTLLLSGKKILFHIFFLTFLLDQKGAQKIKADSNFGEIYGFGFHPFFFVLFLEKKYQNSRLPEIF
jgi:hypothetical protein